MCEMCPEPSEKCDRSTGFREAVAIDYMENAVTEQTAEISHFLLKTGDAA